ncbi:MAG: hypothetical protein ACTTIS_00840 [Streptobacillus sp.]
MGYGIFPDRLQKLAKLNRYNSLGRYGITLENNHLTTPIYNVSSNNIGFNIKWEDYRYGNDFYRLKNEIDKGLKNTKVSEDQFIVSKIMDKDTFLKMLDRPGNVYDITVGKLTDDQVRLLNNFGVSNIGFRLTSNDISISSFFGMGQYGSSVNAVVLNHTGLKYFTQANDAGLTGVPYAVSHSFLFSIVLSIVNNLVLNNLYPSTSKGSEYGIMYNSSIGNVYLPNSGSYIFHSKEKDNARYIVLNNTNISSRKEKERFKKYINSIDDNLPILPSSYSKLINTNYDTISYINFV